MKKEAAAAFIGVSVRTLQRLTKKGDIPVKYVPGKKGEEAEYAESDLEGYLERNKPVTLMRPGVAPQAAMTRAVTGGVPSGATPDVTTKMLAAFTAIAQPARLSEKLLLSLPEAAALSGIPVDKLRSAVKSRRLKAIADIGRGLGKIRRSDLDAYVRKL